MPADHVDPDEQQAARLEFGAERRADLALAVGQLGGMRGAARGEVGADLARAGLAVDRARDLAVDQHDALVALGHRGEEGLRDIRLAPHAAEQFGERGEVGAVAADAEHRRAGIAVERLDDDLAMPGVERLQLVERARDQRRRHEAREVEHEQFLGRVADAARVVDDQRLARDPLEQIGGGDVADVERRILPHQHDVDVAAKVDRAPGRRR